MGRYHTSALGFRISDYPSIFRHIRKPIVWTLHDMNPFLGLMHYESAHQPLPSYLRKLERHCLSVKRRSLGKAKIFPVAISRIMAKSCRLSSIFDNCPLNVIPNGVEVSVFKPSHHLYSLQGVDLAKLYGILVLFHRHMGHEKRITARH